MMQIPLGMVKTRLAASQISAGLVFCCTALVITMATAAPTLKSVSPRGLQVGESTRVTLDGSDFGEHPRIYLDLDGIYHTADVKVDGGRLVADVHLGENISAGLYPLRIESDSGLSNALMVGIDRLPQLNFQGEVDSLPVALHGELSGDQILEVKFEGQEGQSLVIDVEGQRLGSKLRPVLRLLDPTGRQIAVGRPLGTIAGDARISATLPEDGEYRILLHDVVYKAPGPGWFRLKIGDLRFADLVFPPGVSALSNNLVEYTISNLSTPVHVNAEPGFGSTLAVPWPSENEALYTGAAPRVTHSTLATSEYLEEQLSKDQHFSIPAAVNGRLSEAEEEDSFHIQVTPKSKLRFDLQSQRLGSPLDAVLIVATADGKQLGRSDDQSGTRDPGLDIEVPADISELIVKVSSLIREGGQDHIYRLLITPQTPRWRVSTNLGQINLPSGGRQVLPLDVDRGGSNGQLELKLAPMLPSVKLEHGTIHPDDEVAMAVVRATDATIGSMPLQFGAFDSSSNRAGPVSRLISASFPGSDYQSHWRESIPLAIIESNPIEVDWTTDAMRFARGSTVALPIHLERDDRAHGKVRLSLMMTQKPVTKKEGDKQVPDLDRTLRLGETPLLETDVDEGLMMLVVPREVAKKSWGLIGKAELLAEDESTVLATAYTALQRVELFDAIALSAEIPAEITVTAGHEEPVDLKGTIQRDESFEQRVQVTLQGLPKEVTLSPLIVEPGEADFTLPIRFEADAKAGEYKDIRIVATALDDEGNPVEIKTQSNPFVLKIQQAE